MFLLSYALLTCCRTCQHRQTQPLLMSRAAGRQEERLLADWLVNAVVRLSPEGACIHTAGVTATSLSRSSKWVRWDGSMRGEGATVLHPSGGEAAWLWWHNATVSQPEGQRIYIASFLQDISYGLHRASPRSLSFRHGCLDKETRQVPE